MKTYSTYDLNLASTLSTIGYKIIELDKENIKKVKFTGRKLDQKKYFSYSGYPGGLKTKKMSVVMVKNPGEVLKKAVRDMLPPVKFRNNMLRRLIIK